MAGLATEASGIVNETAVNDDPAVHTAAQNAGIEEYKNSVDPGLAEYVDRVRAGEKLEPYVVAETGDRMRSAMMELTGLEKVGDRTLMDSNAVQHITNRHAGGDSSADGTMKESADVARAAYVLNNFDNAYLSKNKADGYFNSKGKRASIVIFEKKIDGSHVVVEAVCDTKKNTNYIVTEYLSKNGVDEKEVAKGLRSPMSAASDPGVYVRNVVADPSATAEELQSSMDAASDPRDTPETLADLPSAKTNIAPEGGDVNGRSYAEETLTADESALDSSGWASVEQKAAAAQLARAGRVSTQGVQTMVDNMPGGIGAQVYTQAAKALYRAGVYNVESFEKALNATGPEGTIGGAVRQVLALGRQGENALKLAYLQGRGEAEVYSARKAGELGSGKGAVRPDAGTVYRGDKAVSGDKSADEAFLKLTAQSTGTAIHRMMQGLENNAKGYIKTAAGEMFFAGDAGSETVMHETFHALNQWSAETGQAVMDRLLNYLVQQSGAESTEKLIQSYLDKYAEAGQQLTYNQALEEITADAMETVFGTAESFRDFVRQQAAEARMNVEARGIIGKVMDKIQSLLESVLADVEHFLKKEPTNAAAKAAKSLTEEQLRDLRALYFEHQMTAGEKYREAIHDAKQGSKNAAASETKDAAVKYSIDVGFEKAIDELDEDSTKRYAIRVGSTSEVLKSIGVKDKDIFWQAGKLRKILNKHSIANHNAATGEGSIMTKEILKQVPQVLEHPIIVLHSDTSRNADYASRIFMYGDVKDAAGKPVNVSLELLPTDRNGLVVDNIAVLSAYGHESYRAGKVVQGEILYVDPDTKRTAAWLRGNRLRLPFSLASGGSKATLHYADGNVKAVTAELLPGRPLYYLKAVTETEAQKLYPEKAAVKYQLEVDADSRDAANSGGLGDVDAQMETIRKAVEAGGNKRVSEEGLRSIAQAVRADHGSKVSAKWLTERLGALSDYLSQGKGVDWADANAFVMDMAEQIMQKSAKRNDELWKAYPELHKMSMQLEKGSAACGEILYRYGSWANARKEAARHGVSLTYTKDGQASRWDGDFAELQKLGAGLLPAETPSSAADALEAMMSAHDAIRPTLENAYDEDWDGAKQDIAMQIWQRYMNTPEMAIGENAQLREQFAQQRKEVRDIARQQALEARAKAQIAAAQQARKAQDDLLEPYRRAAAKANYRKEVAEQFAKKQKASVEARVQLEKDKRLKQVQKARDAREMDNTRRSVQKLTSELTQMIEKPSEKSYVPEYLVDKVRPVAALANDAIGNHEAAKKLRAGVNGIYGPLPADMSIRDAMDGLKSRITAEGEAIFADLTGPKHEKELYHFTHDLVDIGLKTEDGRPWLVTHDVMAELWVQLQNRQGMHHLLHGGATIADMSLTTKGLKGVGRQRAETVKLGELVTVDESGNKLNAYEVSQREDALRTSIIGEIEKNLTEYDNKMIAAFRELGKLTKGYINETSLALSGVKKARVDNYIRLHVDRNTNVEQNTGIQYDNSVGSEGFLQSRVNSSKPLELVGLVRQAAESIENTAQYAGMAIPLRNAEKVLNSMQGGKSLYGQIEKVWGETGRSYLNKALADLCGTKSDHEVFDRLCSTLRGNAAAAVLTGNLNVTLLQAASLPTAAAELGWGSTGKSVLQFVKNVSPSKLAEIEKLAYEHGDAMLPTRLRGSRRGELGSAEKGVVGTLHDSARNGDNAIVRAGVKAADAIGDFASGSIGKVDEITTAALYYGAMEYVKSHPEEFDAEAAVYDSPAYWEAVKQKYQRVIERTQPNYTAMQRTGFQRTKNQMAKTLMMFSTQRQQNAQILVSALEDAAAQAARYKADPSAANKEALETAKARRADAISSQIVQTALIAGLGVGVKLLFHKWGDLQDENGDMTVWSLLSNFIYQFFNSGVSNFTGGSEVWRAAETVMTGKSFGSYDTISMTGFSAVNDMTKSIAKLNGLLDKDTGEMTEEEFAEYEKSVRWAWADAVGQLAMLEGIPYNNVKKYVKAVNEWMDSIKKWKEEGKVSFDSAPSSATGQYDRLYNAIQSGDSEEAAAAMKKLEQMNKTDKVDGELARRLKQYDADVLAAAEARNAGKTRAEENARQAVFEKLREGLGVAPATDRAKGKADASRRAQLIDLVNKAVDGKADELLAGSKDGSIYDALLDEVENGRAKDAQEELDRLMTAGKDKGSIKSKITEAVKEEYLAGSDRDREKLEKKLLALEDADGNPLYEEKDFAQWVNQADKKAEKAKDERNWWEGGEVKMT